mmetsp:Transcript_103381/g.262553  ORF Transcript_103381/g.262553 Transcript_103381/m.262553 type:complete len:231 (+) Transcript_103381:985-1677(+)
MQSSTPSKARSGKPRRPNPRNSSEGCCARIRSRGYRCGRCSPTLGCDPADLWLSRDRCLLTCGLSAMPRPHRRSHCWQRWSPNTFSTRACERHSRHWTLIAAGSSRSLHCRAASGKPSGARARSSEASRPFSRSWALPVVMACPTWISVRPPWVLTSVLLTWRCARPFATSRAATLVEESTESTISSAGPPPCACHAAGHWANCCPRWATTPGPPRPSSVAMGRAAWRAT